MTATTMMFLNRALWGLVTADLRGVAVSAEGDEQSGSVHARFLYEGEVGELQGECVALAETQCIADLPPDVKVRFRAVPNASRELRSGEQWVFLRWEPDV